jgi:DNA-binding CsgD family transcriptional regulator
MVGKLTSKQLEMLKLRYAGCRNKEIALKMNVSESDVSQTLSRAAENIATVGETLALMREIGFIKEDLQIELTKKGSEAFDEWREGWIKDFKSSKCITPREIQSRSPSVETSKSSPTDNAPDTKEMKEQIEALNRTVQEIKELLVPLMMRVETKNPNNKIELFALPYVQ